MSIKTSFVLEITVLSPLHIGTGKVLLADFDFVARAKMTLRIHEGQFVEWISDRDEEFARLSQGVPPGQILGAALRPDSPLVRYALPGVPENTNEIRECIKDVHDRPYVPGSSLKGGLRTVLAWHLWRCFRMSLEKVRISSDKKFAAEDAENKLFGPTPHQDFLRALRLSDSAPVEKENLQVITVRAISRSARNGIPIALEVIRHDTVFQLEGHMDETAFKPWGAWKRDGFLPEEKWNWLLWERIRDAARQRAIIRLERDISWAKGLGLNAMFWENLKAQVEKAQREGKRGFPLQIGFGTGWLGTTLGSALLDDPRWPEVYQRFQLGRRSRGRGLTPVAQFPASRRIWVQPNLSLPLGWVWVVPKEA